MLLKRGGKDMIKQISLKIVETDVVAVMNEIELFRLNNENKTIDIEQLYKKMAISRDDSIENLIQANTSNNKSTLDILYDNAKSFLDELIKKINEVIINFDFDEEEKLLINQ